MKLEDFDFTLNWPKELFLWEGKRVNDLYPNGSFANMVVTLFAEALQDGDIASSLEQTGVASWGSSSVDDTQDPHQVLSALLKTPDRLQEYEEPKYWLERTAGGRSVVARKTLSQEFLELIAELSEVGYFPKLLPKPCVDDSDSWNVDPSPVISKAVRAEVTWPGDLEASRIEQDVLFAVIEFFHDQAQRPRTRNLHAYDQCGYHYDNCNKESGGVVYRWRINTLLERNQVGLKLGSKGKEKGRLIRHATLSLDDLADELTENTETTDDDKVAAAIRLYRARASSTHDRRGAVGQLAGFLEKNRKQFKSIQFAKSDESDLFNIFNNFGIRHNRDGQKEEYGDEYLDWIFWTTLSAIQLVRHIGKQAD